MSKVMPNERISQILPTVKCSDCGEAVQIRKLGDHVCSNMPAVPPLPILPARKEKPRPTNTPSPVSPVHSPGYGSSGQVTPPYYSGMARDLRRPSARSEDDDGPLSPLARSRSPPREDSLFRREDSGATYNSSSSRQHPTTNGYSSPKTPTFLGAGAYDYPRKNSTSPAPSQSPDYDHQYPPKSPRVESPRQQRHFDANPSRDDYSDYGERAYGSPRSDRFGNASSDSLPRGLSATGAAGGGAGNGAGGGALDTLMADLMNSFGSDIHDVNTRPDDAYGNSDSCAACGDDFDYRDDVCNANRKYYHKRCYSCQLCRAQFDHRRAPFEHGGKLYCERDYNVVKKRITCADCDRPITSNVTPIKALGQYYHPGHLKCYHCYEPLDERTGYKEHQGHVYCRADYKSLHLPSCRACGRPVEREAVSAMDGKLDGKWHLDCFGCHTCHRPFPDNTFYVFENLPYCKRHYHQLNNSLCRTCDDPIEGPCAQTIEGWRFHPACFRCNVCRCAITDVYYMFERRIYCETHIRQLQRQRNIRAEKRRTQFGRI